MTEAFVTFLIVLGVLYIKNQTYTLRELSDLEIEKIIEIKIQNIKHQLTQPQFFYSLDQDELSKNTNNIDYNEMKQMLSMKAVVDYYQTVILQNQGQNIIINAISFGLVHAAGFYIILPITNSCLNPAMGLIISIFQHSMTAYEPQ